MSGLAEKQNTLHHDCDPFRVDDHVAIVVPSVHVKLILRVVSEGHYLIVQADPHSKSRNEQAVGARMDHQNVERIIGSNDYGEYKREAL
jgi:hypothetical protein